MFKKFGSLPGYEALENQAILAGHDTQAYRDSFGSSASAVAIVTQGIDAQHAFWLTQKDWLTGEQFTANPSDPYEKLQPGMSGYARFRHNAAEALVYAEYARKAGDNSDFGYYEMLEKIKNEPGFNERIFEVEKRMHGLDDKKFYEALDMTQPEILEKLGSYLNADKAEASPTIASIAAPAALHADAAAKPQEQKPESQLDGGLEKVLKTVLDELASLKEQVAELTGHGAPPKSQDGSGRSFS